MRFSRRGLEMLKRHEGNRSKVYLDPAGHPTAGWGRKLSPEELQKFPVGSPVSRQMQEQWLGESVRWAEQSVRQLVSRPLNQNQFDALVSLVYNIGRRRFAQSPLREKINAGDFDGAAEEFSRWQAAGRRKQGGLVKRRQEEAELFKSMGPRTLVKSDPRLGLSTEKIEAGLTPPEEML